MKILNLYAGVGGNRRLWSDEHEITAVEYKQDIANVYKDLYPKDTVIVADAHEYLIEHFTEFDFIWSSPPCQSHSRTRTMVKKRLYPDMKLYQEIILLKKFFYGKYVIENVIPYYEPLIMPTHKLCRHYFWANFNITKIECEPSKIQLGHKDYYKKLHNVDLDKYEISDRKRQIYRNCVDSKLGLHILNCATKKNLSEDIHNQTLLFKLNTTNND